MQNFSKFRPFSKRPVGLYSPGYFYPIFLAFVETAAKTDEIIELNWDSVDFKRQTIRFPGGDALAERTVEISEELVGLLAKKKPESEISFPTSPEKSSGNASSRWRYMISRNTTGLSHLGSIWISATRSPITFW